METASAMTTAVRDRPRRDWRSTSIPYVAAFSSIAMLGVFVICTSSVSSLDVLAQAVNGGSPAGAPQAQRPPTPTSKLLQPNHDPKEVGSPPSPANVTPSGGSRQPMVQAVLPQVDRSVSGVRNTPSMSVQAGRPRAAERNVGQRITIAGSVLVLPEVAYYGVPVILDVPGPALSMCPRKNTRGFTRGWHPRTPNRSKRQWYRCGQSRERKIWKLRPRKDALHCLLMTLTSSSAT